MTQPSHTPPQPPRAFLKHDTPEARVFQQFKVLTHFSQDRTHTHTRTHTFRFGLDLGAGGQTRFLKASERVKKKRKKDEASQVICDFRHRRRNLQPPQPPPGQLHRGQAGSHSRFAAVALLRRERRQI